MADIYTLSPFSGEVILAAGSATSATYPISAYKPLGNFASQLKVVGDSTITVTLYRSANNGESYVVSPYALWEDKAAGEFVESHGMEVVTHFYIVATATGGTSSTVDMWLTIQ